MGMSMTVFTHLPRRLKMMIKEQANKYMSMALSYGTQGRFSFDTVIILAIFSSGVMQTRILAVSRFNQKEVQEMTTMAAASLYTCTV